MDILLYSRSLGSVRELIDDAGSVRARFNYDPYGAQSRDRRGSGADFGFTGQFYEAETGLDLTWFRAYNAQLARWLSRDPYRNAKATIWAEAFMRM